MRVALIGAELEENIGLRYMASMLEQAGHEVAIVPFNHERDTAPAARQTLAYQPDITGLSMVFTSRAREFCALAQLLRDQGYRGHLIAGGHFAALNAQQLLTDFTAFDSVGLGEGEQTMVDLAANLSDLSRVAGITYRDAKRTIRTIPSAGNPDDLDALPFPRRTTFHAYFDKPIASILSSRGCWRDCAFCSINAWYKSGGGKKFRIRSVASIVEEMRQLYFDHGVRIFNFQDDNFYLPRPKQALQRFEALREGLREAGVGQIAIAVKARPDSITEDTTRVLNDLGLFRVFLGVENASEHGLNSLNRRCRVEDVLDSLRILNQYDVHIAYNILMFELDTTLDDILINLRFIERHIENPFNFCRAEAYAGTGLERKLRAADRLMGDYFGFDYRLRDPRVESFHQIANYAFFDRNFSDAGLHYFNMQVDFYFQLLRRFHPEVLSQTMRAAVRNFIKRTNLDTFEALSRIYDFVVDADPDDQMLMRDFARQMRHRVDEASADLHVDGERLLHWMEEAYAGRAQGRLAGAAIQACDEALPFLNLGRIPYQGLDALRAADQPWPSEPDLFDLGPLPVPYDEFRRRMAQTG